MDLMTTQTIRIFLDCCIVRIAAIANTADSFSVDTLSSESLQNVAEKPDKPKSFCYQNATLIRRIL